MKLSDGGDEIFSIFGTATDRQSNGKKSSTDSFNILCLVFLSLMSKAGFSIADLQQGAKKLNNVQVSESKNAYTATDPETLKNLGMPSFYPTSCHYF